MYMQIAKKVYQKLGLGENQQDFSEEQSGSEAASIESELNSLINKKLEF